MRKNLATAPAATPTRFRTILTTMLLIALGMLIVRDIIIRRWARPRSAPTR